MGALKVVLLVAFVIIAFFLVFLILVQDQDNSGMGGLLGGGNSAAFGSHQASFLTKATVVFAILFFVTTFALAKIMPDKALATADAMKAAAEQSGQVIEEFNESAAEEKSDWWNDDSQTSEESQTETPEETPLSD